MPSSNSFDPAEYNAFLKADKKTPGGFDPAEYNAFLNAQTAQRGVTEPPTGGPSLGEDVAKSFGAGLGRGLIGGAGAVGDVRSAVSSAADWLAQKSGFTPQQVLDTKQFVQHALPFGNLLAAAPTSQQLTSTVEGVTGPFYQPKTTAGEYARTAGEFTPGIIGGPGGLLRRAVTNVAVPALLSETAGQLTAGTPAEAWARAGAALAGGAGASALANRAREVLPTAQQIRDAATANYQHPDIAAVQIAPDHVNTIANDVTAQLEKQGFRATTPEAGASTFRSVDLLRQPTGAAPVTIDDIQAVRKNLGVMAAERNAQALPTPNATAAGLANRAIGQHIENLQQPNLLAGDAQRASQLLKEANKDWAAQSKLFDVETRLTKAERQAARSGMGSNIDNALRQKISGILDVPARQAGYTPEELAQMEKIVRGTVPANALRIAGKLGPHGALSTMLNLGAAVKTGGASIPLTLGALAARKGAEALTQRGATELQRMIARRSALARTPGFGVIPGAGLNALTSGLLPAYLSQQIQTPYGAQ
jgi:hypothetical protein